MASNNEIDDSASAAVDRAESMTITLQQDQVLVHDILLPEEPNNGTTTNIKSVAIVVGETFTELTEAGIRTLEETLSVHANLQYINIERLTHATTSVTVRALIRILRNLTNLTDLRILGTNLQGNLQDWQELATVIGDNLRKLEFICIVEPLAWLPQVPSKALDPVLTVCARHDTLKFVATNLLSGVSLEVIDILCDSQHVMGLHLVDADSVSGDKVYRLLERMKQNTKIWFLSVAFAETITREHGKAIAQLLRSNETITNLSIKSKLPIQQDFLSELIKGLRGAKKLEELSVEASDKSVVSNSCRAAIIDMLEENKLLHKLQLEGVKSDGLVEEIEIFTKLNRAGRRKLLGSQPTDNQNWINVLGHEAVRNELNCTYYLLSKNPQLICCKEESKQVPQTRKRKHIDISTS